MGAGKTTIGKQLAQLLHLEFVDTDQEIERCGNRPAEGKRRNGDLPGYQQGDRRIDRGLNNVGEKIGGHQVRFTGPARV